jgi:ABC-2 type transport system permease protein
VAQPFFTALIELTLWTAIFAVSTTDKIAGYGKEYYLAYVIWASFVARTTSNWMYEFRMIEEIDSGSVNGLLVRPMTFFEYYLSQFMGYKAITSGVSFLIPMVVVAIFDLPMQWLKLPAALLLMGLYLILVLQLSFIVTTMAFHFNRIHSLTVAKNLALWFLGGELVPLDMVPEPYKHWILLLPFANAVYIPVGFITGRVNPELFLQGVASVSVSIVFFGIVSSVLWKRGLAQYAGTGA